MIFAQNELQLCVLPVLHLLIEAGRNHNRIGVFACAQPALRLLPAPDGVGGDELLHFRSLQKSSN
ncbi:hypothetical protein D3C86_2267340 [compost metagenome]